MPFQPIPLFFLINGKCLRLKKVADFCPEVSALLFLLELRARNGHAPRNATIAGRIALKRLQL